LAKYREFLYPLPPYQNESLVFFEKGQNLQLEGDGFGSGEGS
jgi:hypothetical protein